jgi:hypothetical protein
MISDVQLKKIEIEIEEKFKLEMEEYRSKLEKETQEILMTKGITRERMREIEEEVKEEFRVKYSQNAALMSPRTMRSVSGGADVIYETLSH